MGTLSFTKEAARSLAKAYSTPDMIAQREAVLQLLALAPGDRVIDIGCGPGFLCESMAEDVGPEGAVLGVDISPDLLAFCRERTPPAHLNYAEGDALALPVPDAGFDVVVCTQVAEYIEDSDTLLSEVFRVLRPGGRALVMATDWDCVALRTDHPDRMARIMRAWEGHCAHPRLPRDLPALLAAQGFTDVTAQMHPLVNLSFARDSYSYAITKLWRSYVVTAGISEEEVAAWFDELKTLDAAGQYYFAAARMIFVATKPG